MPEAHESMEHAEHAEHAAHSNRKVALVIAILALFLSFSEMLGKSAQTEAIGANVEASNLWSFFQAKTVRQTMIRTATEQLKLTAEAASDPATQTAMGKQIEAWQKTAAWLSLRSFDLMQATLRWRRPDLLQSVSTLDLW